MSVRDSEKVALNRLATALAEVEGMDETAEQVVAFAVESLGASQGGITLIGHGARRFETVGATHPDVREADRAQYVLREGPCVDAAVDSRMLISSDLEHDPRWPRWGPAAAAFGFHSILSVELHGRGHRIGAINLYGKRGRQFSVEDLELARIFAYQSSAALASARSEQGLRAALETRTLIGQAQGILMERFDLDAEQAFGVLRRYSQTSNVKLREVVAEFVSTRELPHDLRFAPDHQSLTDIAPPERSA
jgi:GAF domain-containing protein